MNIQDRPVTVRDMEQFAAAIQSTMREMGQQFVEVLVEMRRSENSFDDFEDE